MPNDSAVAIAVVSLVAAVLSAILTGLSSVRAKRIESEGAPYPELAERVTTLERQVSELLTHQWVDRAYIRALVAGWPTHMPLPEPRPGWLSLGPESMPTPTTIIEPRS